MRVGLILFGPPHGGRESVVKILSRYLKIQGHDVTMIANDEFFDLDSDLNTDKIKLGKIFSFDFLFKNLFGSSKCPGFIKKNFFRPLLLNIYLYKIRQKIISLIKQRLVDVTRNI